MTLVFNDMIVSVNYVGVDDPGCVMMADLNREKIDDWSECADHKERIRQIHYERSIIRVKWNGAFKARERNAGSGNRSG